MGLMEISVIEARGLPNHDFLTDKIDPYVVVRYKGQERKTSIARGQGANPTWEEVLRIRAQYPGSGGDYKLTLNIMDHDTFSSDDFIGQTLIYVEDLLALGEENGTHEMHPTKYRVQRMDGTYCGEIKIGVKFISDPPQDDEEDLGGWKDSVNE